MICHPTAHSSHEVRNPLNGTVGYLLFLQDASILLTEHNEMAKKALECTELALQFLQTLSMMYKLRAKRLSPCLKPVSLKSVLDRVDTVIKAQVSLSFPPFQAPPPFCSLITSHRPSRFLNHPRRR